MNPTPHGFQCPDDKREPPLTEDELAAEMAKYSKPPAASASAPPAPSASATPKKPVHVVKMVESGTDIRGRLAPKVIKETIRRRFPRLRQCYEAAIKRDPSINGLVATVFVIDSDGTTQRADSHRPETTIADEEMISCVERVFACLGYPPPEKSKVLVRYPIRFEHYEE